MDDALDRVSCPICNGDASEVFRKQMLSRYEGVYRRCIECGFMHVQSPHWLAEAYAEDSLSACDVGAVSRALWAKHLVSALIERHLDASGNFLDYGGGPGLFVRLMRDVGFRFYRYEPHGPNVFARYFDVGDPSTPAGNFDLVTAFEVFEHVVNPLVELRKMLAFGDIVLFTTSLQPCVAELEQWDYLVPETGQHVSLYTHASLERLARLTDCALISNGQNVHMFARRAVKVEPSELRYYEAPEPVILDSLPRRVASKLARVLRSRSSAATQKRVSLYEVDFAHVRGTIGSRAIDHSDVQ